MNATTKKTITVETTVAAPLKKAWEFWTDPKHITNWNSASEDWHAPRAENDLRSGGKFNFRMEAKDGSFGFDFTGVYDQIIQQELIEYTMDDGRKASVQFINAGNETRVVETFDAEETNSIELQRGGWQAILNNFKRYVEAH